MAANERTTDDHIRKGSRTWRWPDPSGGVYRTEFKNPLRLSYPFAVKSNASVVPGQFFALPLPGDRWAAGCVLGVGLIARARRSRLIVGLYDWISEEPPTELALVGAQVVRPAPDAEQVVTMVSAREFTAAGIEILGWDSLADVAIDLRRGATNMVVQGGLPVRSLSNEEREHTRSPIPIADYETSGSLTALHATAVVELGGLEQREAVAWVRARNLARRLDDHPDPTSPERLQQLSPAGLVAFAQDPETVWSPSETIDDLLDQQVLTWRHVEALVDAGMIEWPATEPVIRSLVRDAGYGIHLPQEPLLPRLREHPTLIGDGILYRLLDFEGDQEVSLAKVDRGADHQGAERSFAGALVALAETGELDRDELLDRALQRLVGGLPAYRAAWFRAFHDRLDPTVTERAAHLEAYLALFSSPVPATASFAVSIVHGLMAGNDVSASAAVPFLGPALAANQKSTAQRAVKIAEQALTEHPGCAPAVVAAAGAALAHREIDIQHQMLQLLEAAVETDPSLAAAGDHAVRARWEKLAPEVRARHTISPTDASASGAAEPPTRSAAPDPLHRAYALAGRRPGVDPDPAAALDAVRHALESPTSGDAQDVALDAISRHPSLDATSRRQGQPIYELADEILRRSAPGSMYQGVHEPPLAALALAWISVGEDVRRPQQPHLTRFTALTTGVAARLFVGPALPTLSLPTHKGGFIDPRVLDERIDIWLRSGARPDVTDANLALGRIPPDQAPALRRRLLELPSSTEPVGEVRGSDQWAGRTPTIALPVQPDLTWSPSVDGIWIGRTDDDDIRDEWQAFDHRVLDTGDNGRLYDTSLGWWATVSPPDQREYWAMIAQYYDEFRNSTDTTAAPLEPLVHRPFELGELGHIVLLVTLANRARRVRDEAVRAVVTTIADGRFEPRRLGAQLGRFLSGAPGGIDVKRLATGLAVVAEASMTHRASVVEVVTAGLRGDPANSPRNIGALLEVLYQQMVATGIALEDLPAIRWLRTNPKGGKTRTYRDLILAFEGNASGGPAPTG